MAEKHTPDEFRRLRESEEKYRRMIERANDAILSIDPATAVVLEVNPKTVEMTGFEAKELVGKKVWELHPKREREEAAKLFMEVTKKRSGVYPRLHFLCKSGDELEIDVNASVIEYGDKKVIQRICRDVSARKMLEERHEFQREYYEYILDMMPVGLGVRKNVNTKPVVEFENKKLKEMFHGDDKKGDHQDWHEASINQDVPTLTTLDPTGVYAEERSYPDGKVYQFTLSYYKNLDGFWSELQIVRDVTRRRGLENDLKKAKEDLEHKVEERTLELRQKQAQLVQSEKMAALGHLVAGVAHEINTPLGALKSNSDLFMRSMAKMKSILNQAEIPESVKNDTALAKLFAGMDEVNAVNQTAMKRIVTIVRSLRKFARLDEAELDKVDIREGLESTLTLVYHELKNRIKVHKDLAEIPPIKCYPNQLNQVFMNLLVNASQAIGDDGEIFVNTYQKNDRVIVEIRDTGKGIPPENLKRIFDPGFTTKGSGVGTGLGLSIVYQIIQDHKGDMEVESAVGQGTTFRILLPTGN